MKRILHTMRHRLIYRFLLLTFVLLFFLVIEIAFDDSILEWSKMTAGAIVGIGYAFFNRPRVSHTREIDNSFYLHYSSNLPGLLRILNGIAMVTLLVSFFFVEVVYLLFASFCASFTYMILIFQFEGTYGQLRWGKPED